MRVETEAPLDKRTPPKNAEKKRSGENAGASGV
jgi:hypothetical protein